MSSREAIQINQFLSELVSTLVALVEHKDAFMKGHAERVAQLCKDFASSLRMSERTGLDKLYFAGLLHDIGMVYLPLELVQNPDELGDAEMALIKAHPETAVTVLGNLTLFSEILPMIRHHHERWDGSGYPDGLKAGDIPLGAQILAMADTYDALTSKRPHRPPITPADAYAKMTDAGGTQFDPQLVTRFTRYLQAKSGKRAAPAKEEEKSIAQSLSEIITEFKKGKIEMPVLPQVVEDVRRVLSDSQYTGEQLATVIEKDAAISVRLIAVANSPYYRGVEQIASVRTAISRVGHKETQNIVTAIAQRGLFETKNIRFKQLLENLWVHSLACGYAAGEIARKVGLNNAEELFFLGVVHDIGKAVLLSSLSRRLPKKTLFRMPDLEGAINDVVGGFTAAMLRRWNFSKDFLRAVAHHEMEDLVADAAADMRVLNLANHLVRKIGYVVFSSPAAGFVLAETPSAQFLKLGDEDLDAIGKTVKEITATASSLF